MQKIILVGINYDEEFDYTLALGFLKSYALNSDFIKQNTNIKILEYTLTNLNTDQIVNEILNEKPDLIGFSCYAWNIRVVCGISKLIREKSDVTIIFGGPEATISSKSFLKYNFADYLIIGEGEKTFSEILIKKIKSEKIDSSIKGIMLKDSKTNNIEFSGNQELIENIDEIPSPYITKSITSKSKRIFIETMRGCNFRCGYCETSRKIGRARYMSLEKIEEQIKFVLNQGYIYSFFYDSCSNQNPERFEKLLKIIIKYEPQFKENLKGVKSLFLRTQALMLKTEFLNKKSIELLGRTSFKRLELGLQTINSDTLKNINRSFNIKKFQENVSLLKSNKLLTFIDLIIGLPGDNFFKFMNSLRFLNKLTPFQINASILRVVPDSKLYMDAEKYKIKYDNLNSNLIIENYSYSKKEISKSKIFFNTFNKEFNSKIS